MAVVASREKTSATSTALDLETYVWEELETTGDAPEPFRSGHQLLCVEDRVLYLMGGWNALSPTTPVRGVHVFTLETKCVVPAGKRQRRGELRAAALEFHGRIRVCGAVLEDLFVRGCGLGVFIKLQHDAVAIS